MNLFRVAAPWFSVLLLGSTVALAADPSAPPPAPGTLRFRIPSDPATLDWNLAHTHSETYVIMNLMEGLLEEGPDLKPVPALAESWSVTTDGKQYTFKIRKGVKWMDGVELKAAHFVDSWKRLMNPSLKSSYASFLSEVSSVAAPDDFTFVVNLKGPVPHFIHMPTFWVTFPIRKDLVQKFGTHWADPARLVTLGPYKLSTWDHGKRIVLERNPTYWGKSPSVERAEIDIEADDGKTRSLFSRGWYDFLLNSTTEDFLSVKIGPAGEFVQMRQFPYLATYYLGFNTQSGPLRDVNFRKAVAQAINPKAFPAALQGGQLPATGWIPPGVQGGSSGLALEFSLYDARAALSRAGYAEGTEPPKLDLWVSPADGAQAMGKVVTDGLKQGLGITVTSHLGSSADFQAAVKSGKAQLFLSRWGLDYPDPSSAMEVFLSSSGTNYTRWKNPQYDAAVAKGRSALIPREREDAFRTAEEILLRKDVAVVPLFHSKNTVLVGRRVHKLEISPLNYLFLKGIELK
ncbi:MAG TPA: peptide ABC transporter substrate-binding protein [Bdellovibrionota bacterium]|jgi:oligopeptide transport system substrate-binding protein|nr:peptide ABC transporter substrate-binding protein [Bdellovibrionota bacterium]